jgi:hypothetical protein
LIARNGEILELWPGGKELFAWTELEQREIGLR